MDKFVLKDLQKAYDEAVKYGDIDPKHFERSFKENAENNRDIFLIIYMRMMALFKFPVFALVAGFPFNLNPVYREYYSEVDKNSPRHLMLEYDLSYDENLTDKERKKIKAKISDILDETIKLTLLEIPRGAKKTTLLMIRAAWKYFMFIIIMKRTPTILITHGSSKKAESNLELIKGTFAKPAILELFQDVLRYETKTKSAIRFRDHSEIKRRENHFETMSVNGEPGGNHYNFIAVDDWVLDMTTDTIAKNEQNKNTFYKLLALDDRSGYMTVEMVGTEYVDDSLYVDLKQKDDKFFHYKCVPASTETPDGTIYNFPEILSAKKLEYWKNLMPPRDFNSQLQMIAYSREADVHLTDNDDFLFAYADDTDVPEGVEILTQTKDEFMATGGVIICKDPSYSIKGKTWDSSCSKDTTVSAKIKPDGVYYIEGDQLLGGTTQQLQQVLNNQARITKPDVFVCDAQGTQFNTASDFYRNLSENLDTAILFKPYKASNLHEDSKHLSGKANIAQAVLGSQFAGGVIRVHYKLKRMIKEIKRETQGFDFIDTMVMVDAQSALFSYLSNKTKTDEAEQPFLYKVASHRQTFRVTGS